jgi:hypothetical protein
MKLCKDCKHYNFTEACIETDWKAYASTKYVPPKHECFRVSKVEMVLGNKLPPHLNCFTEREDALRLEEYRCGKEGKFWEAK